jgi:hypothetical protein
MTKPKPVPGRTGVHTRNASLLLSSLMLTPDEGLEAFRSQRLPAASIGRAQLQRARDILDRLAAALTGGDPAAWAGVERAWEAWAAPEPHAWENPLAASPAPSSRLGHPAAPSGAPAAVSSASPTPSSIPIPMPAVAGPPTPSQVAPGPVAGATRPRIIPPRAITAPTPPDAGVAPLPFVSGRAAPPPPASDEEDPHRELGETLGMDTHNEYVTLPFAVDAAQTLDEQVPADLDSWTAEHYAAFQAACLVHPGDIAGIERRYGIRTQEARQALDDSWRARLSSDGALARAHAEAFARHRIWALRRARK